MEDLVESLEGLFLGRSKVKILTFLVGPFSQKLTSIIFFYFGMNLPKDGTKPLDKDGFD